MICPICGSPVEVIDATPVGFTARCSGCFSDDPRAIGIWRRLRATEDTAEQALEQWLLRARNVAASGPIPALPCPLVPRVPVVVEVLEQAQAEFERQRGFRLVEGITFERDDEYVAKRSLYLEIDNA